MCLIFEEHAEKCTIMQEEHFTNHLRKHHLQQQQIPALKIKPKSEQAKSWLGYWTLLLAGLYLKLASSITHTHTQ